VVAFEAKEVFLLIRFIADVAHYPAFFDWLNGWPIDIIKVLD
jgi:ribosome-associated toxin RatA of RatAB toxin-antitoxin module